MTEYWVSQGNKWCEFCKIFIANNPSSIRNHDLGTRHKENVALRLTNMRKESAAKEKEQKEAARALEQIEAKAKRSYQKDIATLREARDSNVNAFDNDLETSKAWDYESSSGYYYNQSTGFYYDPNSGFYYSDALGKWVTQEEAFAAYQVPSDSQKEPILRKPLPASGTAQVAENKSAAKSQSGPAPGLVISASLNPTRSVKGAPSSLTVGKRKRPEEKAKLKPKIVSEAEAAALKAREAAKKRMEEREKPLLGLYKPL